MNRIIPILSLGLVGCVGLAAGDQACTPLGSAATQANLNALLQAADTAATELNASSEGMEVVEALAVDFPTDTKITVFAPSDAAFQTVLQASTSEFGVSLEPQAIAQVILNHVVPGDLTSTAIKALLGEAGGSTIVQTLFGSDLHVTTVGDGLYVQSRGIDEPGALVIAADTVTCVGPVHVIDEVLLPQDLDGMTFIFASEAASGPASDSGNGTSDMPTKMCASVGMVATDDGLTSLVDTIRASSEDLKGKPSGMAFLAAIANKKFLTGDARVTVFAPTNEAFTAAAQKFGGTLPEAAIADVLLNHAVPGDLTADNITTMLGAGGGSIVVQSLLKSDLFITTTDDGLTLQSRGLEAPGALVVTTDAMSCLGPVHVIDTVLLPTFADGSLAEFDMEEEVEGMDSGEPVMDGPDDDGEETIDMEDGTDMGESAEGDTAVEGMDSGVTSTRAAVTDTNGAAVLTWGVGFVALAAAAAAMV